MPSLRVFPRPSTSPSKTKESVDAPPEGEEKDEKAAAGASAEAALPSDTGNGGDGGDGGDCANAAAKEGGGGGGGAVDGDESKFEASKNSLVKRPRRRPRGCKTPKSTEETKRSCSDRPRGSSEAKKSTPEARKRKKRGSSTGADAKEGGRGGGGGGGGALGPRTRKRRKKANDDDGAAARAATAETESKGDGNVENLVDDEKDRAVGPGGPPAPSRPPREEGPLFSAIPSSDRCVAEAAGAFARTQQPRQQQQQRKRRRGQSGKDSASGAGFPREGQGSGNGGDGGDSFVALLRRSLQARIDELLAEKAVLQKERNVARIEKAVLQKECNAARIEKAVLERMCQREFHKLTRKLEKGSARAASPTKGENSGPREDMGYDASFSLLHARLDEVLAEKANLQKEFRKVTKSLEKMRGKFDKATNDFVEFRKAAQRQKAEDRLTRKTLETKLTKLEKEATGPKGGANPPPASGKARGKSTVELAATSISTATSTPTAAAATRAGPGAWPSARKPGPERYSTWDERFEELEHFKKEHSHTRVPVQYENKSLARWVQEMRREFKALKKMEAEGRGPLVEREEGDEEAGCPQEDGDGDGQGKKRENEGDDGKGESGTNEDGDGDAGNDSRGEEQGGDGGDGPAFTKVLSASKLNRERIAKLDALGFVWSAVARESLPWDTLYEMLVKFKKEHGHTRVPRTYKDGDIKLGDWVHSQRTSFRRSGADIYQEGSERHTKLLAVGFEFQVGSSRHKKPWHDRFEQLLDYRRKFGNCDVAKIDPVKKKRKHYTGTSADDDADGDDEAPAEREDGEDSAASAKQFATEEEAARAPCPDGICDSAIDRRAFGAWVRHLRADYVRFMHGKKVKYLDKTRIRRLNEVGFDWGYAIEAAKKEPSAVMVRGKVNTVVWDERFGQLCDYVAAHGHTRVPQFWKENPQLARWVAEQRRQHKARSLGKLHYMFDDRMARLESIDFEWSIQDHSKRWNKSKVNGETRCDETRDEAKREEEEVAEEEDEEEDDDVASEDGDAEEESEEQELEVGSAWDAGIRQGQSLSGRQGLSGGQHGLSGGQYHQNGDSTDIALRHGNQPSHQHFGYPTINRWGN